MCLLFFFFLFLSTPRATQDGRGAWSRSIPPADASYLRAWEECPDRGHGRGVKKKKTASPNKGLRSRSNGSARMRACVRRERYDLSLLCLHTCALCVSAILKWYLFFFQIRPVEPLLPPPVNSFFKIIKNNQHSSSAQSFSYEDFSLENWLDPGSLAALAQSKLAGHCCFQQLVRGIRRVITMQSCFFF